MVGLEELADAFLASESVIRIGEGPKGARFTTQRIYELEQRALAAAERMRETTDRVLADPIVVSRVLDARPSLKADQRAMVSQLLGGGRALEAVIGEAGTGDLLPLRAPDARHAQPGPRAGRRLYGCCRGVSRDGGS